MHKDQKTFISSHHHGHERRANIYRRILVSKTVVHFNDKVAGSRKEIGIVYLCVEMINTARSMN